jgi:hypothetical protein
MAAKLKISFRVAGGAIKVATGREAETIQALVNAGDRGITSLDTFKAGWAVRLSAYVFDLKAMGVPVTVSREPHDGGNHARYKLAGSVTIIPDATQITQAAA